MQQGYWAVSEAKKRQPRLDEMDNLEDDLKAYCRFMFVNRVKKENNNGCWLWKAKPTPYGYGRIMVMGRSYFAHRFSWAIHKGAIPRDKILCHKCNIRLCVNPDHLYIGTYKDNYNDTLASGKLYGGIRHPMAILNEAQVRVIKRLIELKCMTYLEISNFFGVKEPTIGGIACRKTWRDI